MSTNIRYIDSLKVGAYQDSTDGPNINIQNNVGDYVITAVGLQNTLKGEPELRFDSVNLGIGTAPSGLARLEIHHTSSVDNLMLIKNTDTNTGLQVNQEGILQLFEFSTLPTAVTGGLVYSADEFWVGVDS